MTNKITEKMKPTCPICGRWTAKTDYYCKACEDAIVTTTGILLHDFKTNPGRWTARGRRWAEERLAQIRRDEREE
jgi:tRNA(Ile2) C34 agmatinyltransferase TiaS